MRRFLLVAALGAVLLGEPGRAIACSHLWRFSEFYSSPDRSVQFIEMQEIGGSPKEWLIGNHWYQTNTYNRPTPTDLLDTNIPNTINTANKKFLVGSQSYAALPGVPAPDYVIPDGVINPAGDTVVWWFYQTIQIPAGVMPSDGTLSISVVTPANPGNPPVYSVGVNSPTNLAGQTGTVVLATAVPAASRPWLAVLAAALVALGLLVIVRRSHPA
jgi:hypothetical protein